MNKEHFAKLYVLLEEAFDTGKIDIADAVREAALDAGITACGNNVFTFARLCNEARWELFREIR